MTEYVDLTQDNLLDITDLLDDETLLSYCQTNKEIANLCDHKVWLHRIFRTKLTALLSYAVLYPSLREFYLNIRKDALYQLMVNTTDNKSIDSYYTTVDDIRNTINKPNKIRHALLLILISNTKYNIEERNSYTTDPDFPNESFLKEIDKLPNLFPRSLIAFDGLKIIKFTSEDFRKATNSRTIQLRNIEPYQYVNITLDRFTFGFRSYNTGRSRKILTLLDESLVNSEDNNYYAVITYIDPIIMVDSETSVLPNYLSKNGTYYKIADLPLLIKELS